MRPGAQPQPPVPEDAPRPCRHGLQVERREFGRIERGRCAQFQHDLARGRQALDSLEARFGIERARPRVLGCDEQADAPAPGDAPHLRHCGHDGSPAVAQTLATAIHREPAQPPTRAVTRVRVHDVEPDRLARILDGDQRMRRPPPHRRNDVGDGTQKAGDPARVQLDVIDKRELCPAESPERRERDAPDGNHGALDGTGRGNQAGMSPACVARRAA